MTSKNQVSPVIRISRGERDASARATHLKAASKKYLESTIERKQMSTTTNFKRIALVAVAALGLGLLSSAPSQAAVSGLTVTTTNGTATKAKSDSSTAGSVTINAFATSGAVDTVTVEVAFKSGPSAATGLLSYMDSSTSTGILTPTPALNGVLESATAVKLAVTGSNKYIGATLKVFIDTNSARSIGDYVYTVVTTPYNAGVAGTAVLKDVTISVAALAIESLVGDPTNSQAILSSRVAGFNGAYNDADSTVAVAATAAAAAVGHVRFYLRNAAGGNAQESLTVTIDKGLVGNGGVNGRSLSLVYNTATDLANGYKDIEIYADGTVGAGTITLKTASVTKTKVVNFYSTTVASIAAQTLKTVIGTGTQTVVVAGVAKDANGLQSNSATAVYAYSSDTSVVTTYGTACTFDSTLKAHYCNLEAVKAGAVKITLRDKSTVALSTVISNAVDVLVSTSSAATVKLAFDKATYAPGEKAKLTVSVLDAAGKSLPAGNQSNLFATGGITSSVVTGNGSDTTTAVSITTATSAADAIYTPIATYTIYMPSVGGTVKMTATGGASLPLSGQVEVSATATVTDSGAAALAAVTALATTVASLRTLIVTLTNLVLKIQKKVRA